MCCFSPVMAFTITEPCSPISNFAVEPSGRYFFQKPLPLLTTPDHDSV